MTKPKPKPKPGCGNDPTRAGRRPDPPGRTPERADCIVEASRTSVAVARHARTLRREGQKTEHVERGERRACEPKEPGFPGVSWKLQRFGAPPDSRSFERRDAG